MFGKEVKAYLDETLAALIKLYAVENEANQSSGDALTAALDRRDVAVHPIRVFPDKWPKLVKPYVKMHQKASWF